MPEMRSDAMKLTTKLITLGAALRLTRLVVVDEIGQWWIKDPIDKAAYDWYDRQVKEAQLRYESEAPEPSGCAAWTIRTGGLEVPNPWWWKYRSGLDCPFCVGFWIGALVLAASPLFERSRLVRFVATALAFNELTGHVAARLGDTAPDPEEETGTSVSPQGVSLRELITIAQQDFKRPFKLGTVLRWTRPLAEPDDVYPLHRVAVCTKAGDRPMWSVSGVGTTYSTKDLIAEYLLDSGISLSIATGWEKV
jgi:hypothetical protein